MTHLGKAMDKLELQIQNEKCFAAMMVIKWTIGGPVGSQWDWKINGWTPKNEGLACIGDF